MKPSFNVSIYIAIINAGITHTPEAIYFKAWMLELDYETEQEDLVNAHNYRIIQAELPNALLKYLLLKHSTKKSLSQIHSMFCQQIWLLQYCCPMYVQTELLSWITKKLNERLTWTHD